MSRRPSSGVRSGSRGARRTRRLRLCLLRAYFPASAESFTSNHPSAAQAHRGAAQKNSPFEPTEGPGFVSGEKPRCVAPGLNSGYFAASSELTEPAWGDDAFGVGRHRLEAPVVRLRLELRGRDVDLEGVEALTRQPRFGPLLAPGRGPGKRTPQSSCFSAVQARLPVRRLDATAPFTLEGVGRRLLTVGRQASGFPRSGPSPGRGAPAPVGPTRCPASRHSRTTPRTAAGASPRARPARAGR
jgi:hypothetical protein